MRYGDKSYSAVRIYDLLAVGFAVLRNGVFVAATLTALQQSTASSQILLAWSNMATPKMSKWASTLTVVRAARDQSIVSTMKAT